MSNSESFNYNTMEVKVLGVKKDKDGVLFTNSGKDNTRNLEKKTHKVVLYMDINTIFLLLSYCCIFIKLL